MFSISKKIIFLFISLSLISLSCEREWISNEFIRADAGSNITDYGIVSEEPAKEEPMVIKKTDLSNSKIFTISDRLILPAGNKEFEIGTYEGGQEELPAGPMSFTVGSDGKIHILDNLNGAIKIFNIDKSISNIISLGDKAKSIIDITIPNNNQISAVDINSNLIYIIPKTSKAITDFSKMLRLPDIKDFSGIYNTTKGNIFIRYGDQQSFKISDSGLHIPFMSIISRSETLFLRTKKISGSLSMLFMSSSEQSANYKGNTEKQIEISIGMPLLSISLIDTDKYGRPYLLVEADNGGNETVNVKRFIIRAGTKDEDWSKPFEIPLDVLTLPFKDIVIGEDGTVYVMLVYKDRVEVVKWKEE